MIEIQVLASSSKGNCYRVTDGVTPLLLDCGIPILCIKQKLDFKLNEIKGVLLSHSHKDHSKAVPDILNAGIDVYMDSATALEMGASGHRARIVVRKKQFKIGLWTVLPFELQHDVTNLGFLLANGSDKLLYITDTAYCKYKFNGITHLLLECNYAADILQANVDSGYVPDVLQRRLIKSHFSLDNVKAFLLANDLSKVQEIHLIHLSAGNGDAERFKREVMELTGKPVYIAGGTT